MSPYPNQARRGEEALSQAEPQGDTQAQEDGYDLQAKAQALRDHLKIKKNKNLERLVKRLITEAQSENKAARDTARANIDGILGREYTDEKLKKLDENWAFSDEPQATPDAESTDANSRTFRRNGTDVSEIIEGRKAIKDAPDGTIIKTRWTSGEERTHVVSKPPEGRPTFQERGGNGQLVGKPYALTIDNIREVFGGSNLQEIRLIYPENGESSIEAVSNSDDEQALKSPETQPESASSEPLNGTVDETSPAEQREGEPQYESPPVEATPETEPTGDVEGETQLPSKRHYRKGVAGKFKKWYPEGTIGYELQKRIKPDTHPYLSKRVDTLLDRAKHDDAAKAELKDILNATDEELIKREQALKPPAPPSESQYNVEPPNAEETTNKQPESSLVEETSANERQGETTSGEQSDTQEQPPTQEQAQPTPAKRIDGIEGQLNC